MKTIALFFGGRSGEYTVSLSSAAAVLRALDPRKYHPLPIGITREGAWLYTDASPDEIAADAWAARGLPCLLSPSDSHRGIFYQDRNGRLRRRVPDVIFSVLHGGAGEDGRMAGLFSMAGIPFVGAPTEGSALAMNKALAKLLAREAGVPTLPFLTYTGGDVAALEKDAAALGYPLFVKPLHGGSSIGAGIVREPGELCPALARACDGGDGAMIEPYFPAREVELAVLEEGGALRVSAAGEIEVADGFYDFAAKYQTSAARLFSRARISRACEERLRRYAAVIFRALGLTSLARVDFFVSRDERETIYFNEVNALPGFTEISMFPRLLCEGRTLSTLLDTLIDGARAR